MGTIIKNPSLWLTLLGMLVPACVFSAGQKLNVLFKKKKRDKKEAEAGA